MTQILSGVAAIVAFFSPSQVIQAATEANLNAEFVWVWRGLITASFALNIFFVQRIYRKVQKIGPHQRAINTLQVAVEYLAREADTHGAKRTADHLVFKMLDDVKKLTANGDEQ